MKKVAQVVRNVAPHWVGDGFPVRSLFSYGGGSDFDPFLLLDYAGPHEFTPGTAPRGVGEHPHRGFETVTIVYQGELEHRDSGGNSGTIGAGDVQWMTAASGVVHEEFHSQRFTEQGGTLEMVQLWVNLPSHEKMSRPRYQGLLNEQFPTVKLADGAGSMRVIAGEQNGAAGPAQTFSPIIVADVQLAAGGATTLAVPSGHTAVLVVERGAIHVGAEMVKAGELVRLERDGTKIELSSPDGARVLLLAGKPLGEPVVGQGPFVMNTREEIQQAIADFRAGRMGRLS